MKEEIKGISFFIFIWCCLLLLNFIPVIGTLVFVPLSAIWVSFTLAFEFSAPSMDRRGFNFTQKRQRIFRKPLASLGLGSGLFLLSMMPLVNLFFLPCALVAGTIWFIETENSIT